MLRPRSFYRDQVHLAATALATAATAGDPPVLHFSVRGLTQVGAGRQRAGIVPMARIVVTAPTVFRDQDDLRDLAAHRLRRAALRVGNATLNWPVFDASEFAAATDAIAAAANRLQSPSQWMALSVEDLTEIDLVAERSSPAGVLWLSLDGMPLMFEDAYAEALRRLLSGLAELADPEPDLLAA